MTVSPLLQSLPPCAGAGLVHVLFRVRVPRPQGSEHGVQSPHSEYPPSTEEGRVNINPSSSNAKLSDEELTGEDCSKLTTVWKVQLRNSCYHWLMGIMATGNWQCSENLPGQGLLAQDLLSSRSPVQSRPEKEGSGSVQLLVLVLVPPPHVALHSDHEDHSVSPPFIAGETGLEWER